MAAWQFEGTVSYSSGKRVACTAVSLGAVSGNGKAASELFRTDTDLSGRFQAVLREMPPNGNAGFCARAFDAWRAKEGEWVPVSLSGTTIVADLVLPWEEPDICNSGGQWFNSAQPLVEVLIRHLEKPGTRHQSFALRLLPLQPSGNGAEVLESYPRDPALERMWSQFQEEVASAQNPHAAKDIARRISDCLLRMGFARRFEERIDVFRFALQGIHARPKEDRKMHVRNLLKAMSVSLKRPFVPGNGAVVELESSAATLALVLYAGAFLSLGRTDLQLKKETQSAAALVFQVTVPGLTGS
jgi:hypothetical protein